MLSLLPKTTNTIYNIGDCVEFKRYISGQSYDMNEYVTYKGYITNTIKKSLVEVNYDVKDNHEDNHDNTHQDNKDIGNDKIEGNQNNDNQNNDHQNNETYWINPISIVKHYPKNIIPKLTTRLILKDTWKDLIFREVKAVKLKDEYMVTCDCVNSYGFIRTKIFKSVDEAKSQLNPNYHDNIKVHYRDYYGFTTHRTIRDNDIYESREIFFSRKCYGELNLNERTITGDFSLRRGFKSVPPQRSQYVCGLVEMGEKGLFYRKWFICSKEFMVLWTMLCNPDHSSLKNDKDIKTFNTLLEELNPGNDNVGIMSQIFTSSVKLGDNSKNTNKTNVNINFNTNEVDRFNGNTESILIYFPDMYYNIARLMFDKKYLDLDHSNNNIYPSYIERFENDITWMK